MYLSPEPPTHATQPKPASLASPRLPSTANTLIYIHQVLVAQPLPAALLLACSQNYLDSPLLLPPQLLPFHSLPLHLRDLLFEVLECVIAAGAPGTERGLQGRNRAGSQVAERGDGRDSDEGVRRVQGSGQQAGVDSMGDELFEGTDARQVQRLEEGVVCEGGMCAREREQREQQKLLVLLC